MENQDSQISLTTLWTIFKKGLLWIILTTLLLGAMSAVLTKGFSKTTYTVRADFRIDAPSGTTYSALAGDIIRIIDDEKTTKVILENAGIECEPKKFKQINRMINVSQYGSNALIRVSVTGTNIDTIVQVVQAFETFLPNYISSEVYAGRQTFLRLYSECDTEPEPNDVPLLRNTFLGMIVGFSGAYVFLLVLYILDKKVYSRKDINLITDLPVLGEIPTANGRLASYLRRRAEKRGQYCYEGVLISSEENTKIADAYRIMRTNLIYGLPSSTEKCVFAVTGASRGSGASTMTLNLATAFAGIGKKVLVLEANLRNPVFAKVLSLDVQTVLNDVLQGTVTAESAIVKNVREGLDVLPAGKQTAVATADLLASESMKQLIEQLRTQYDFIFIDLPEMVGVSDAGVLAPFVDQYLITVRVGYTGIENIEKLLKNMQHLKMSVAGFCLLDVPKKNS